MKNLGLTCRSRLRKARRGEPAGLIVGLQLLQHVRDMEHREHRVVGLGLSSLDRALGQLQCDHRHRRAIEDALFKITECASAAAGLKAKK